MSQSLQHESKARPRYAEHRLRSAVVGLRGTVRFNAPLKDYTSFRIGGPADFYFTARTADQMVAALTQALQS